MPRLHQDFSFWTEGPLMQARSFLLLLLASCSHPPAGAPTGSVSGSANPEGVAAFSRHAQVLEAKISPKGTYVAIVSDQTGKRTLSFIRLADRSVTFRLEPSDAMVGHFEWASDERVAVELVDSY